MTNTPIPEQNAALLNLTGDIVSAHVSHNHVPHADLPTLIASVYTALESLSKPAPSPDDQKPKPAVSIRQSVKPDFLVCLEDGAKVVMLKRYLQTNFDMSPEQYRARWNLPSSYPMIAPNYAMKRAEIAKRVGLGRKPQLAGAPQDTAVSD
jgi:predicted transcriptional regulator